MHESYRTNVFKPSTRRHVKRLELVPFIIDYRTLAFDVSMKLKSSDMQEKYQNITTVSDFQFLFSLRI